MISLTAFNEKNHFHLRFDVPGVEFHRLDASNSRHKCHINRRVGKRRTAHTDTPNHRQSQLYSNMGTMLRRSMGSVGIQCARIRWPHSMHCPRQFVHTKLTVLHRRRLHFHWSWRSRWSVAVATIGNCLVRIRVHRPTNTMAWEYGLLCSLASTMSEFHHSWRSSRLNHLVTFRSAVDANSGSANRICN